MSLILLVLDWNCTYKSVYPFPLCSWTWFLVFSCFCWLLSIWLFVLMSVFRNCAGFYLLNDFSSLLGLIKSHAVLMRHTLVQNMNDLLQLCVLFLIININECFKYIYPLKYYFISLLCWSISYLILFCLFVCFLRRNLFPKKGNQIIRWGDVIKKLYVQACIYLFKVQCTWSVDHIYNILNLIQLLYCRKYFKFLKRLLFCFQLWQELCDLISKNPDKVGILEVWCNFH